MKKLFLFLTLLFVGLSVNAQLTPVNNLNYVKFLKVPPTGLPTDQTLVYDSVDQILKMRPAVNESKEEVNDANKTITGAGNRLVAYTAITADRTVTLPPATTANQRIWITDESGLCSNARRIIVQPNGSDVIGGDAFSVINFPNGSGYLESNGSGKWNIISTTAVQFSSGVNTMPTITDNGNGSVTLGTGVYSMFANTNGTGRPKAYQIPGGTFTFVDGSTNYIYADYNTTTGAVTLQQTTTETPLNDLTQILIYAAYRQGTTLHPRNFDTQGIALSNKINRSIYRTQRVRFEEGGILIGESASPAVRTITISAGTVWVGATEQVLSALTSATNTCYHVIQTSPGVWTTSTVVTQYNNTQYNTTAGLQTLVNNDYGVNWLYRSIGTDNDMAIILGGASYTLGQAQSSSKPTNLPPFMRHMELVGRIIVQKNSNTATQIDNVSSTFFTASGVTDHNALNNLQTAQTGVTYGHITDAAQTIAGVKTFSSSPIVPNATTSTQAVNKSQLDSKQNILVVNVKDYGATGNGTTDDTSAINAAFAALMSSGGGTLFFPKGVYHSVTGYTFTGDNITIEGDGMPMTNTANTELTGGTILRGQVLIDGDNIYVKNIGVDFGVTYSNAYRSGAGGNALVVHDASLSIIQKNIKVENVIGLIRLGDFTDPQAAFHAILIEGVQYGSAINVHGVGGWFGVVVKATDFLMNGITGRYNDTASIYIKSNSYAPANRVVANNLIVENFTSRGYTGVLVQSSDAEMEDISVSNVTVVGGGTAFRVESETTSPLVSFSLNGLTARNIGEGMSIRGQVYSPVISNCSIYQPDGNGLTIGQNSVSENAIDALVNNIRIVPSATTTNSVLIDNPNVKGVFSNINVANSDGKTLITGSVINLQPDSDISNYVGILKRAGTVSDVYRFKGGGITTSLSNISSTLNTRIDLSNPPISLGFGYLNSDAPFIQSYNNTNNASNSFFINPFGGAVVLGNTSSNGLNEFQLSGSALFKSSSNVSTAINNGLYIEKGSSSLNYNGITFQGTTSTDMYFGGNSGSDDIVIRNNSFEIMRFNPGGDVTTSTPPIGDNDTSIATTAFVKANARPYLVYTALLSQSGTSSPTATVLENTLGGTVTFGYSSAGVYTVNCTGCFTSNKTFALMSSGVNGAYVNGINLSTTSQFFINTTSNTTGAAADSGNNATAFEIRVYP